MGLATAAVILSASLGVHTLAGAAPASTAPSKQPAPPTPPPIPTRILGSDPTTCDSTDSHRQIISLKGTFPALDNHGALLIVTKTGRQPIALPYDPKSMIVPSFSYGNDPRHLVNVLYDGTQWCAGNGQLTFQLALGGMMSNIFTMQIDSDDDDDN